MATQTKQVVYSDKAPAPKPFLSQAVTLNGLVYTSGAVGMDPATEKLIAGTTGDRTVSTTIYLLSDHGRPPLKIQKQCLKNLANILEAAGSSIEKVLKVSIYLDDMTNYASMNEGYLNVFTEGNMPVRTCVAVKELPLGTDVEIEVIAHQ